MRLEEIITRDEWEQLARIIYDCTWHALTTYQHQHPANGHKSVQQLAVNPTAKLKPHVAKKAQALTRKAKRIPHAASPRPLPKPQHVPQAKAEATPAYRPIKTVKPLPPTTRKAVAKTQSQSNNAVQQVMPLPPDMDQAARRMLPPDKRGPNPMDLLAPQ